MLYECSVSVNSLASRTSPLAPSHTSFASLTIHIPTHPRLVRSLAPWRRLPLQKRIAKYGVPTGRLLGSTSNWFGARSTSNSSTSSTSSTASSASTSSSVSSASSVHSSSSVYEPYYKPVHSSSSDVKRNTAKLAKPARQSIPSGIGDIYGFHCGSSTKSPAAAVPGFVEMPPPSSSSSSSSSSSFSAASQNSTPGPGGPDSRLASQPNSALKSALGQTPFANVRILPYQTPSPAAGTHGTGGASLAGFGTPYVPNAPRHPTAAGASSLTSFEHLPGMSASASPMYKPLYGSSSSSSSAASASSTASGQTETATVHPSTTKVGGWQGGGARGGLAERGGRTGLAGRAGASGPSGGAKSGAKGGKLATMFARVATKPSTGGYPRGGLLKTKRKQGPGAQKSGSKASKKKASKKSREGKQTLSSMWGAGAG